MDGTAITAIRTDAVEPVIRRSWLSPGVHVTSVGYNRAGREVDDATIVDALVCVESRRAVLAAFPAGSNDLLMPINDGVITAEHILAELGELVAGTRPGRTLRDQITLYSPSALPYRMQPQPLWSSPPLASGGSARRSCCGRPVDATGHEQVPRRVRLIHPCGTAADLGSAGTALGGGTPWTTLRGSCGAATSRAVRAESDHTPRVCGNELLIEPTANHSVSAVHPASGTDSGRLIDHFKPQDRPAAMVRDFRRADRGRCGGRPGRCPEWGGGLHGLVGDHGYLGLSDDPIREDRPRSRANKTVTVRRPRHRPPSDRPSPPTSQQCIPAAGFRLDMNRDDVRFLLSVRSRPRHEPVGLQSRPGSRWACRSSSPPHPAIPGTPATSSACRGGVLAAARPRGGDPVLDFSLESIE